MSCIFLPYLDQACVHRCVTFMVGGAVRGGDGGQSVSVMGTLEMVSSSCLLRIQHQSPEIISDIHNRMLVKEHYPILKTGSSSSAVHAQHLFHRTTGKC